MVVNQFSFVAHFNPEESNCRVGSISVRPWVLLLAALPVSVVSCTVLHALNERVKDECGA